VDAFHAKVTDEVVALVTRRFCGAAGGDARRGDRLESCRGDRPELRGRAVELDPLERLQVLPLEDDHGPRRARVGRHGDELRAIRSLRDAGTDRSEDEGQSDE
jgi:hypothetical protein